MKNKQKLISVLIAIIIIVTGAFLIKNTNARYVVEKNASVGISMANFYFDATKDSDIIFNEYPIRGNITVGNNDGTSFTSKDLQYVIGMDKDFFDITVSGGTTRTLLGTSMNSETISFEANPKSGTVINGLGNLNLVVSSKVPFIKNINLAIQDGRKPEVFNIPFTFSNGQISTTISTYDNYTSADKLKYYYSFDGGDYTECSATINFNASSGQTLNVKVVDEAGNERVVSSDIELKLANVVSVGDIVAYNPGTATLSSAGVTGATLSGVVSTSEITEWKVLSVDSGTGVVKLIASQPTTTKLSLSGASGYQNAVSAINNVAAIFGNGSHASGAYALTIEDINRLSNYTPNKTDNNVYTYNSGKHIVENSITEADEDNQLSIGYTNSTSSASTNQGYSYTAGSMFAGKSCWVASKFIQLNEEKSSYGIRRINSGNVASDSIIYNSDETASEVSEGVLPVVTLEANVKTSGKDGNNVWQLE